MSFWSDPGQSISDAVSGIGNDISKIPQDISQFVQDPSQSIKNLMRNPGAPEAALLAGAYFTGGADLIPALTDILPESLTAAAPEVDTTQAAYDQILNAFQNPNVITPMPSTPADFAANSVAGPGLSTNAATTGFNTGITNAGYNVSPTNYAIGSGASNGITAGGAGVANGLSVIPSAASVGATGAASYGLDAAGATSGGVMDYFNSALDFMKDNKTATAIGAGILGSKLGLFNKSASPGINTTYTGPLTGYRLSPNFKPGGNANPTAINPNPYRNYVTNPYVATGKEGGEVKMAMGGMPGQIYPQSQQMPAYYSPPPAMPNNMAQMLNSNMQPMQGMQNPIPVTNNMPMPPRPMASGGIAGYASGNLTTTNDYLSMANTGQMPTSSGHHTDALMNELSQYTNMATNPDPFHMGYGGAPGYSSLMGQGIVSNDDPDLRNKNPYQRAQIMNAKLATMANMQGPVAAQPNTPVLGTLNMAPPQPAQTAARGGIMDAYANGGVPGGFNLGGYSDGGRLLRGPGDGMSDNIPATIAHKQPARLADGEFVVPADVVSHLGNGSTDAGAKRLYAMMDKVREARTGSKKQGKEIKAEKYLPA